MSVLELKQKIEALSPKRLIAFDVDGTLVELTENPNLTTVPEDLLASLRKLGGREGYCVAIVTGRDEKALRRMLDFSGLWVAVEHGGLLFAPDGQHNEEQLSRDDAQRLTAFENWAQLELKRDGVELERKRTGRGVHVRKLARDDAALAALILEKARHKAVQLGLHPREGRMMFEADALQHNKAAGLESIFQKLGATSVVYLGDDITDFPALEKAMELDGLGVFISSDERSEGPGNAILQSVSEVHQLITALLE
ncbi:MAG: trehalose-phosphatase [Myxococcales bacterium]|nr:MAG: trehalose-phosphatase [Myxococcales bacterium]